MNLKINRNGSAITIPLQSAASRPRLAARYNNTNFYAPFVATGAAGSSPFRIRIGNSAFALSNGVQPATDLLTQVGIDEFPQEVQDAIDSLLFDDDVENVITNHLGYMPKDATEIVAYQCFVVNAGYDESQGDWFLPPNDLQTSMAINDSTVDDYAYVALVLNDLEDYFWIEIVVYKGELQFPVDIIGYSYVVLFILQ